MDIAAYSHPDCTCESFEDTFNLVVLVLSLRPDVQIHACSVRKTLEEMQEHFRGHLANLLAIKLGIPNEPRTATEVEGYGAKTIIHGKGVVPCDGVFVSKAITFDAAFIAEGFGKGFAKGKGGILDRVVLINMEVATDTDIEVDVAVLGYLLEHVIKEAETCRNGALACAIKVEGDGDVGLLGCAGD